MADLIYEQSIPGLVAGCDEAGRGSWAGPLVAAAVILPKNVSLPGVNDSKQVSKNRHRELADLILKKALYTGIGIADNKYIDAYGVGPANRYALEQAVKALPVTPDFVLVDGGSQQKLNLAIPQEELEKGDQKSLSIAAASILAKSVHDVLMCQYAETYPAYHWEENAGYGTESHRKALEKYGLSLYHRKSVAPVRDLWLEWECWQIYEGGWYRYLSKTAVRPGPLVSGKWMYFFKDQKQARQICEKAILERVCPECKYRDMQYTDTREGLLCFYIDGTDMDAHRRVLTFMLENGLIPKTKNNRFSNISFKFNSQTRAGEYGTDFKADITLSQFLDLNTGEWLK